MKVLKHSEYFLVAIGAHSTSLNSSSHKFLKNFKTCISLVAFCCFGIPSAAYIHKHSSNNFTNAFVQAFIQLFVTLGVTGAFISVATKTIQIIDLFNTLQGIVNGSNKLLAILWTFFINFVFYSAQGTEAFEIYRKVESMCRIGTKWLVIVFSVADVVVSTFPSFLQSIICMSSGDFDTSNWFFAVQIIVPLNKSNILIWYLLVMMECPVFFVGSVVIMTIITFFVSCCFYIKACCDHFQLVYRQIEDIISDNLNQKQLTRVGESLTEAILLHIKIKKLVKLKSVIFTKSS